MSLIFFFLGILATDLYLSPSTSPQQTVIIEPEIHPLMKEEKLTVERLSESGAKVTCKTVSQKEDCNTCTYTLCNDGEFQWSEGIGSCTTMYCGPSKYKFNPDDWKSETGVTK